MNTKMWVCLGLFILPVIGMSMVLMNFVDFDELNFGNKKKDVVQVEEQGGKIISEDGWITDTIDEKEITYRFGNSFSKCSRIDDLIANEGEANITLPKQEVTRVAFLKTILTVHCIDYEGVDATDVDFADVGQNDIETREIIKAAMILGISNGYDVDGVKEFRANTPVTKIEALTMLIKLADLQIQGTAYEYEFVDVKRNWQDDIANTSAHLGLTSFDKEGNNFFPKEVITKESAQKLISNITAYYR